MKPAQYLFGDVDPYLDVDYGSGDLKLEPGDSNSSGSDGVVPVQVGGVEGVNGQCSGNEGSFDLKFTGVGAKESRESGYEAHYVSQSVSTCRYMCASVRVSYCSRT